MRLIQTHNNTYILIHTYNTYSTYTYTHAYTYKIMRNEKKTHNKRMLAKNNNKTKHTYLLTIYIHTYIHTYIRLFNFGSILVHFYSNLAKNNSILFFFSPFFHILFIHIYIHLYIYTFVQFFFNFVSILSQFCFNFVLFLL